MEGDNAYLCEELGRRVPALKRTCIKVLPTTLVIHLKRFEFNYHSQTRFKVRDRFEFPLELDAFPYTADGLAAEEAAAGSEGGGGGGASGGGGGGGCGGGGGGAQPRGEYLYDLAGVVVHSGSAFTGHYYSFARERAALAAQAAGARRRGAGWYCFDDKSVRPWDVADLEADCFGGPPSQDVANRGWRAPRGEVDRPHSAYMLFYERRAEAAANAEALRGAEGRSAQPAAAAAAAAAEQQAAGGGGGSGGGGDPPPQAPEQQAQAMEVAAVAAPPLPRGALFVAPWGMPLSLYRGVMLVNITIMQHLHTLDRDFFKFVRQLVETRADVGSQLSQRKARRRELPPAPAPAAASGGSCSAMSCDPGPGGGAAAAADGAPGGGGGSELPSPGPSGRRGEEAEAVAVLLTRLALRFQLQLYQRAAAALRSDSAVWAEVLKSLLNTGPAAGACQLAALQLLQAEPAWLRVLLVQAPDASAREFVADLVGFLLTHAAARCNLQPAADEAAGGGAGGSGGAVGGSGGGEAASPLVAALLAVVDALSSLLQATVVAAAGPDGVDSLSVGAVAAVLRDYVAGAPPAHGARLVARGELVLALVEHLAALHAGGADYIDELRDEGPPVVRLLYALVSRATNLERLAVELNAAGTRAASSSALAGVNPHAAAGRGPGRVVDAALPSRAFKR
jgi:hypothetical protein